MTVIVTVEHLVEDSFGDENRGIQDILSSFGENDIAVVFFKDEFKEFAPVDDKNLSRKLCLVSEWEFTAVKSIVSLWWNGRVTL